MADPRTTDSRPAPLPPAATPTPTSDDVPVLIRSAGVLPGAAGSGEPGPADVTRGEGDSAGSADVQAPAAPARPLGLSLTQIAGGALAAVTAAVAASFLGVAGTLVGAALGSVVSSVAAALYSTSLTRAARVSKVLVVRPAGSGAGPLEASAQDPAAVPPAVRRDPIAGPIPTQWWNRVHWRPVALVAGLLFVAAMAVVSVSELALGHPLGNSGATGTTLTNLGGSGPATTPAPSGGTPKESATSTPSPTPSEAQASPTPTASPTGTPGASPTSSPAPSSTGTTTSSPTTGTATTTTAGSGTTAPAPPGPTPGG